MIAARRLIALVALSATSRVGAQHAIRIEAPRGVSSAPLLGGALAQPHDLVRTDSGRRLVLPRNTTLPRTTIVLGGNASIGASVRGDVVVVGGDLFLQPGAAIDGRAVAIGGGVYGSTLASVEGGIHSFRDHTYDIVTHGDSTTLVYRSLRYREPAIEFPILDGLRVPAYDRVNGASVPWGPVLRPTARTEIEPIVTYRSHIGAWDPGVHARQQMGPRWYLTTDARRATFTNEAWIRSDLLNTVTTLFGGSDTRNYYRADRGELAIGRAFRSRVLEAEGYGGVLTERAWSVGAPDTLGSRPWSLAGRGDSDNLARANPAVTRGRISSAFLGVSAQWRLADVRASAAARLEVPWETPGDARFAQVTLDGTMLFPTFRTQRFRADVHVVVTPGDSAPPQRFSYVGGGGTLPVIRPPLLLGGDQLVMVESRYEVPIDRVRLPFIGSPLIAIRHRIGSAGIQRLPRFTQNAGIMLAVGFVGIEYAIDPASREGRTSFVFASGR